MSSQLDPQLAGSLRVARVGDAMLPVSFVNMYTAALATWGLEAAEVNNARVRQAVQFLAANANQRALVGSDALKALVYAISAGQAPERSYEILSAMILGGTSIWQPACMPTKVEVV
jgi:type II secretory pathway component GspD/PulD (secretin)